MCLFIQIYYCELQNLKMTEPIVGSYLAVVSTNALNEDLGLLRSSWGGPNSLTFPFSITKILSLL